jgi:hypothetical protein
MNFNNIAKMYQDDLTKSITGEQYDTQVPMRRPEQAQNPRMEALRGIASRAPQQQAQISEDMNFFNAAEANKVQAEQNSANIQRAKDAELRDPSGAIEDKKEDNSKMAGAIGDLGKALAGPTEAINVGQYSTFRPEDTMGDIRRQVLESIRARG